LILREPHPDNLRADRWYITLAGTRAMQRARTRCAPVIERMVRALSKAETARFEDYLRRCIAGLGGHTPAAGGLSTPKPHS
jgi:DNA-binding MarR family transcriptional regulator